MGELGEWCAAHGIEVSRWPSVPFPRGRFAEAPDGTVVAVTIGADHRRFSRPARVGHDEATGAGLVNVEAALSYVLSHFS